MLKGLKIKFPKVDGEVGQQQLEAMIFSVKLTLSFCEVGSQVNLLAVARCLGAQ